MEAPAGGAVQALGQDPEGQGSASPRAGSGVGTAVVGLLAAGGVLSLTDSRSVEEHTRVGGA
ncbi:hypothetical protein EDD98_6141 [Streptomyces sp. PanSC19]|uniref:hypothetical protein n=1 Tax=Streptomyces sp. PanSC19 TaxID=1520455 RepID=UPI000F97CB2D|nr:hypothetical protein [Streptomyces sp. PanSC19]ROQ26507.1 hypothetical protein EDD98_6141 [Streptomyces sp. PanSC19]